MFWTKTKYKRKKINLKNIDLTWDLNPGSLAQQSDASPLGHGVNVIKPSCNLA